MRNELLFGEWAGLWETMIPMCVLVCSNYGKIELRATEDLRQKAVQIVNSAKL